MLEEARKAQTSTMTRFIQARARVMQVEARLQAMRAQLAAQAAEQESAAGASTTPGNSSLSEETTLAELARVLNLELPIDEVTPLTPPRLEESEEDEDTKKRPVIQFLQPPVSTPTPAQQNPEEEETLLVSMSALLEARQARQAAANEKADQQASPESPLTGEASTTAKTPLAQQEHSQPLKPA